MMYSILSISICKDTKNILIGKIISKTVRHNHRLSEPYHPGII